MKNEKSIETPVLLIKGNIMLWEDAMIQLSNVSYISKIPLELLKFPMYSLVLLLLGILTLKSRPLAGFILLIGGFVCIYLWYTVNEKRKSEIILFVCMNSGKNFQFLFNDMIFLGKVLRVLEEIIIEGSIGKQSITINMNKCEISGNASVLNDLNLS